MVVYPDLLPLHHNLTGPLLYQPEPKLARFWGVRSARDMRVVGREAGLRVAWDTTHARRSSEQFTAPWWQDSVKTFFDQVDEIHVSVGRIDLPEREQALIPTMRELADLYVFGGDRPSTEIVAMLELIAATGWRKRIVVEIPAKAVALLLTTRLLRLGDLVDVHARIVDALREIFK